MSVKNIPTRFALIERGKKMLNEIDKYFDEAYSFGLSAQEADPKNDLIKIRTGLIEMLIRENNPKAKS